jgi:hypothetical protein
MPIVRILEVFDSSGGWFAFFIRRCCRKPGSTELAKVWMVAQSIRGLISFFRSVPSAAGEIILTED